MPQNLKLENEESKYLAEEIKTDNTTSIYDHTAKKQGVLNKKFQTTYITNG